MVFLTDPFNLTKKHNVTASSGAVSFVPVCLPKSLTVRHLRRPRRPKSLIYKDLEKVVVRLWSLGDFHLH